jgi:starch synthase
VVDATEATLADGTGSGFAFTPAEPAAFLTAIQRAVAAWKDKKLWRTIQHNGMRKDFSWDASARKYVEVYRSVVAARGA